jgi:hypothetical protein
MEFNGRKICNKCGLTLSDDMEYLCPRCKMAYIKPLLNPTKLVKDLCRITKEVAERKKEEES